MTENEINMADVIINYVNTYFLDGDSVNQVKNFKNLTKFINKNGLSFELNFDEYEKLLCNKKIINMISTLLNLKENALYLQNPLFYSLALIYCNNNGIKLDLKDQLEYDDFIDNNEVKDSDLMTNNSVKAYLDELKYEPFTPEEEKEIFKRYSEGETYLKNTIIKHNLRLVVNIAKRYVNPKVEFLDLIQEGNIGLDTAVDKYDYKTGNKFSTYATWWIRQAIVREINNNSRTIRIPIHLYEVLYKVEKYIRDYELMLKGDKPTPEKISKDLNINIEKVKTVLQLKQVISLSTPVGMDGSYDAEIGDFVEDESFNDLDQSIYYEQFRNLLFNSNILNDKEKAVIMLRFGFKDGRVYRLEEIGKMYNITRERIRQIESKALRKLKTNSRIKKFDPKKQ